MRGWRGEVGERRGEGDNYAVGDMVHVHSAVMGRMEGER